MGFNLDHHLKKRPIWITKFFRRIDEYCLNLREGITRTCLKTYIRYNVYGGGMFCRVFITANNMKIYLKVNYSEIENPPAFIRDYSGMARSKDTIELTFDNEESYLQDEETLFTLTSGLIEDSFNRVTRKRTMVRPMEPKEEKLPIVSKVLSMRLTVEGGYVNISIKVPRGQLNRILDKILY